ncbi:hypothetical protein L1987_32397 [Smallanthus sonchifolius]|uniref:Uncharacterized protein n=1 Tax=Smallanthus sonchifolius TaxID=185202 RepID=A0ACB9HMX0_9ASTR|nr:hypothetical protein L1987_32397 [Smallanthus sonchifolius]
MRALVGITITNIEWNLDSETEVRRRKEGHDNISIVIFPSNLYMHSFHCLRALTILGYNVKAKVVFEIESTPTTSSRDMVTATNNQQPPLLPNLQVLELCCMDNMSHIWKCNNWNKFLIFQQQSSFLNLTTIKMWSCNSIKYLFSPLMAKLLSNLKTIDISDCDGMEEVVSNRDDKHEEEMTTSTTTFFPHLHLLSFGDLVNLNRIGGGGGKSTTSVIHDQFEFSPVGVVSWSLCQYSREINIYRCNGLSSVIPSNVLGQMQKLQVLKVQDCKSLMKVFETQGINNNVGGSSSTNIDEGSGGTDAILRQESINVPQLSNLKKLVISSCNLLQLVFTFSTLGSLEQLEELMVKDCDAMKVIVKKENGEQSKVVEFPRLKSLELRNLPNLDGFYLGMNDFNWPLLEKAIIGKCPQIMKFTSGWSTTPALKDIHTSLGKHSLECGLNFHLKTSQTRFPSSESTSLEQFPWSFHNLIELHMERDYDVKCIIPSNELLQLQKLERIRIQHCDFAKEVFEVEAMEGTNSEESQTIIQIPNLTQMELEGLSRLKYIWKSSHRVLEFPNLTTLSIKFCNSLKHVFNSSMVGSLLQLQHLHIFRCQDLEVIVKEEESESKTELIAKEEEEESELELIVKEEEEESEVFEVESQTVVEIPKLREVELTDVESLKYIWKGTNHGIVLQFPNLTKLSIYNCKSLEHVFTSSMVGSLQQLQELYVSICPNMEVIVKDEEEVEEQEVKSQTIVEIPNLTQMKLFNLHSLKYIWKSNHHHRTILEFPSLTTLVIHWCESLEHAFTSSMVGSLQQLQDLHIRSCKNMEVIVKEEEESESDCDAKVKQPVTFPCLKSLKLDGLKSLKGFCLGNDDFSWPSLHTLEIIECPQMTVFTNGHVATPALDVIDTRFGRFYIREDLNSFIKTKQHENAVCQLKIVQSCAYT